MLFALASQGAYAGCACSDKAVSCVVTPKWHSLALVKFRYVKPVLAHRVYVINPKGKYAFVKRYGRLR